jgi:hypothetical protein
MLTTYLNPVPGKLLLFFLLIFSYSGTLLAQQESNNNNLFLHFSLEEDSSFEIDLNNLQLPDHTGFTTTSTTSGFTVYFKKPLFWASARIHYWDVTPAGTLKATSWPGVTMRHAPEIGQEWYSFTFSRATSAKFIFNSGMGGYQTPNLSRDRTGFYNPDRGGWVPNPNSPLVIHFKKPSTWGNRAFVHLWNIEPHGSYNNTTWPGIAMTANPNLGAGWFSITLSKANCTNLVFNDGNGRQTGDLSLCGEGWYDNGWKTNQYATIVENQFDHSEFEYVQPDNLIGDNLKIFPNPATSNFTIEYLPQTFSNLEIKVVDTNGREFVRENLNTESLYSKFVLTEPLGKGIYLVSVNDGKKQIIKRVLVK